MNRKSGRYIALIIAVLLLSFLAVWTGFYYLLILNLILFDIFISRKVDWTLRKYKLPSWLQTGIEWVALLILALVLSFSFKVLFAEVYKIPTPSMEETLLVGDYIFVSKLAYGPRLPQTPLALPFYHNKLPSGRLSYSRRISLPYKRLKGFSKVRRGDVIVFNFPEGDSMVVQYPGQNYYSLSRQYGREYLKKELNIIVHPVDKRENYIKRCFGLPGDTLQITGGACYVNGTRIGPRPGAKYRYYVSTGGEPLSDSLLDSLKILKTSLSYNPANSLHLIYLTREKAEKLGACEQVRSMQRYTEPMLSFQNKEIFPHHGNYRWTGDDFGPVVIPKKGDKVKLNSFNIPLYQRIIEVYEGNMLKVRGDSIEVNGNLADSYTFRMDYYFVMGDNHHNSADSRYWGFVPEDHLLGKAVRVFFSVDPEKSLLEGFRKERIFKSIL